MTSLAHILPGAALMLVALGCVNMAFAQTQAYKVNKSG